MSILYDSVRKFEVLSLYTEYTGVNPGLVPGVAVDFITGDIAVAGISPIGITLSPVETGNDGLYTTTMVYGIAPLKLASPCIKGQALTFNALGEGLPGSSELFCYALEAGVAGEYVSVVMAQPGFLIN